MSDLRTYSLFELILIVLAALDNLHTNLSHDFRLRIGSSDGHSELDDLILSLTRSHTHSSSCEESLCLIGAYQ